MTDTDETDVEDGKAVEKYIEPEQTMIYERDRRL